MPQLGKHCIWCKGSTEKTDLSHVMPVSLGNTEQILSKGVVCKSCNNSFSRKIEPALIKDPVIQAICALFRVVNSRTGKIVKPRLFERHDIPLDIPHLTPELHLRVTSDAFELTVACKEAGVRDTRRQEYKRKCVAFFSRAIHKVAFESLVHDQMTADIKLQGLDLFDQAFNAIRQWVREGEPQNKVRPLARMVVTPIEPTWQLRGYRSDQYLILALRFWADLFIISATSPHDQVEAHLRQWCNGNAEQIVLIADQYGPLSAGEGGKPA